MRKTIPVCAPETTIKTVVSGIGQTAHTNRSTAPPQNPKQRRRIFYSAKPEECQTRWRNLALSWSTQSPFAVFTFFLRLRFTCPKPPIFIVFSGLHQEPPSKKSLFWKPLKTRDKKRVFDIFALIGPETPIFAAFSSLPKDGVSIKLAWSGQNGVQWSTRKCVCMCIYI